MKTVTVKACVHIPVIPNFLRQADDTIIPIEAISEEGLKEIGEVWTQELIKKAKEKTKVKKEQELGER